MGCQPIIDTIETFQNTMDSKSKIVHGKDSAAGIAKLLHDLQYKV
jgi:hypothetical protein